MNGNRIASLDAIRGLALMFILLFHCSIYNFANIHKLDFSNPPILIVLMSFMALWGGVFIIYSLTVNSLMLQRRSGKGTPAKAYRFLLLAGLIYLVLHYVLNMFLGRWNIDFVNNQPHLTFVAGTLRNMELTMPPVTKLFEGSSLSTIALNLIIVSGFLVLLTRNKGLQKTTRNCLILGISGFIILIGSFIRVSIYPVFSRAVESGDFFTSISLSFLIANPYPLLPYLSYGLFGAMIGLMIYSDRKDLLKKVILPLGLFFLIFGIAGMMNFDKTISKPDYFWYFKTNFELGVFLLLAVLILTSLDKRTRFLKSISLLNWFGRVSLTIYLLETLVSEILRIFLHQFLPDWDQTINGCLTFGLFNIFIWAGILFFWRKINFKYSLEYFWVQGFSKLGKRSTKLDIP
jgi:surface polysaccharide O-acyltransferase-like enzyme